MRLQLISALVVGLIVQAMLGIPATGQQQYPNDPLTSVYGERVSGEFMELRPDTLGLRGLHTGIDITANSQTPVYPPIADNDLAYVISSDSTRHYAVLQARRPQDGQYAYFLAGHINLSVRWGQDAYRTTVLGRLDRPHLHAEVWLSPGPPPNQDPQDIAVNPRDNAFKDVTDWTTDNTAPTIQGVVKHTVGSNLLFEIRAYDRVDANLNWRNGIKGLQVCVNNWPEDSFEFTNMSSSADASDFYYCADDTCMPDGSRALVYKLLCSEPSSDYIWYVAAWDGKGTKAQTAPVHSTIAEAEEMDGRMENGMIHLRWTMHSPADVAEFAVLERCGAEGPFTQASDTPIRAVSGQRDYEFVKLLPENGDTLWYRVMAVTPRGGSFLVAERHFPNLLPVANGLRISPNPSTGAFQLQLQLRRNEKIRAAVFESSGRLVQTLCDLRLQAGRTVLAWDGRDERGRRVAAGRKVKILKRSLGSREFGTSVDSMRPVPADHGDFRANAQGMRQFEDVAVRQIHGANVPKLTDRGVYAASRW